MRKMKLVLEELRVESFEVVPAGGAGAGTVFGRADEQDAAGDGAEPITLPLEDTCLPGVCTCWYSCDTACPETGCWTNAYLCPPSDPKVCPADPAPADTV